MVYSFLIYSLNECYITAYMEIRRRREVDE